MIRKILLGGAAVAAFSSLVSAAGAATFTVDFTALPRYTTVTTIPDGTVSLIGGPGATGPAVTGSFGAYSLGNSPTGSYPTANILDFAFSAPVKNISFTFDNFGSYGYCSGHRGCSYASTNTGGFTDLSGNAFGYSLAPGSIAGSSVTDLQFHNGVTDSYNSWEFGVGEITYTTAVPEPATWAMLLSGFGFIGYVLRRRVLRAA